MMIEQLIAKHLAVNGHTEGLVLRHLVAPGAGFPTFNCTKCAQTCLLSNQMTFIDWDLIEFLVCPVCFEYEMYHKIQMRKMNPYYFLKKEVARGLGVPFP